MLLRRLEWMVAYETSQSLRCVDIEIVPQSKYRQRRRTTPDMQGEMIGRLDLLEQMVQGMQSEQEPNVVYIVGEAGIGKTRLAQTLFHHARISEHFDGRVWVHVSSPFNRREVLMQIARQLGLETNARKIFMEIIRQLDGATDLRVTDLRVIFMEMERQLGLETGELFMEIIRQLDRATDLRVILMEMERQLGRELFMKIIRMFDLKIYTALATQLGLETGELFKKIIRMFDLKIGPPEIFMMLSIYLGHETDLREIFIEIKKMFYREIGPGEIFRELAMQLGPENGLQKKFMEISKQLRPEAGPWEVFMEFTKQLRPLTDPWEIFNKITFLFDLHIDPLETGPADAAVEILEILILEILIERKLNTSRCLIVLDDVWNSNDDLMKILGKYSGNKIKIIVTTRICDVAAPKLGATYGYTTAPINTKSYVLQPLEQKLALEFLQPRWADSCHDCSDDLIKDVGAIFARNCGGVPLLMNHAAALAILQTGKGRESWQKFLREFGDFHQDEFWQRLPQSDEHKLVVLESGYASFKHLPRYLKSCLLHCSLFPLDYNFDAQELADLLVAEGCIPPTVTATERRGLLKKFLDECFNPLEDSEHSGEMNTYRMHKTLHLFAKYTDRQFSSVVRFDQPHTRAPWHVQHALLFVHPSDATFPSHLFDFKYLTTLILVQEEKMRLSNQRCEVKEISREFCQSLRQLRALSLQASKIRTLPNKFELMYLRYLNLSRKDIDTIPGSIGNLKFLGTLILSYCEKLQKLHENTSKLVRLRKLDLEGCHYLVELPQDMSKMRSLEYLNVFKCSSLTQMPPGMGQLINLETLLGFVASNNYGCTISELRSLLCLHSLSLENLEKVSSDKGGERLRPTLESLALRWNMNAENSRSTMDQLFNDKAIYRLKTLEIVGYGEKELPSGLMTCSPCLDSLVEISLVNLKASETLPPLGLLPCLKIVEISGAEAIECVDDKFCGCEEPDRRIIFPSLEKLTFSYMKSLKVWKHAQRRTCFPHLAEVTIIQCPELALHVQLPSVKKLILWMNNRTLNSSEGCLGSVASKLEYVSICFCEELVSSSDGEGLQCLDGLKKLEICGCDEMTCLPQSLQRLSSLTILTIDSCSKLETLPDWLENLPSLELVCLSCCPMLSSISEGLRLKSRIEGCPNLPVQSSGKHVNTKAKSKEIMEEVSPWSSIYEEASISNTKPENMITVGFDHGRDRVCTLYITNSTYKETVQLKTAPICQQNHQENLSEIEEDYVAQQFIDEDKD